MKSFENFSDIEIGKLTPMDGPVERCPRCGRAGVLEPLADGHVDFIHTETEEVMGDGMLVEPVDWCCLKPC
jgi:hypothetical protein